ncbi:MAG: copper ABC transporter ATP-binding protein [Ignavibacteria bacterium CG_4_8_14_3_um_filter_37_9]|nr:ABC transporter ATP-binding protein [Ignavibacteria bacterium]OIO21413.1 MAG: copper ABC transporter ATP-binding protein [Ignavibacteria bacterium CG1_02_37_35]PIS46155.1 MAG: copper ABC transporter ATP-binding protein [Ignavibacteria bacterium CG08_land_8_20_14_0_20_37_9]PIW99066.1 MAG: copper ABC transporter ATP-binding protein [Ignavibacteria bacterium CG_4_8_14_3_um_filter_37_9]PIX94269.1 MAG: copper ABC transporter ATP-binding protein [Ignavibacteria bacterium CG_4_10_14_3_um_filter_37_
MIKTEKLYKKYGTLEALKSLNIEIKSNRLTYIVGPNGSGKTTFIKTILGLVKPTSGNLFVDGVKLNGTYLYREKIGYMPQIASFPENLSVKEVLNLLKEIRSENVNYDEELIRLLKLEKEYEKRIKNLSGGTKQKLNAVIAFLFDPPVLILDEPSAGLDPVSSSILKDKILREKKAGKTILFTSHILSELEELAEEIIFLLEGSVCFSGGKDELILLTGERNLERAIANLMMGQKI